MFKHLDNFLCIVWYGLFVVYSLLFLVKSYSCSDTFVMANIGQKFISLLKNVFEPALTGAMFDRSHETKFYS